MLNIYKAITDAIKTLNITTSTVVCTGYCVLLTIAQKNYSKLQINLENNECSTVLWS
jgi:hypothetical protein